MIYFDNAASGGFKPGTVIDAANIAAKFMYSNPGRSAHRLANSAAEIIFNTRKNISRFFNNDSLERVCFTKNCTEALNTALFGTVKQGGNIITSAAEHNSILRPLYQLQKLNLVSVTYIDPDENGKISLEKLGKAITKDTYLAAFNHISNVTGNILNVSETGKFLREKNIIFLMDAAQSCGHVPVDMQSDCIDILCFPSHKGLYGIQGGGGIVFNENTGINPLTFGGTGTETFNENQPENYPERLESGTLSFPAISALNEGIKYTAANLAVFNDVLMKNTKYLINELNKIEDLRVYSGINPAGIVSFESSKLSSMELSTNLSLKYDIATRGGFHCAPRIHKLLKTDRNGLLRASLSAHNTIKEIDIFVAAVRDLIS